MAVSYRREIQSTEPEISIDVSYHNEPFDVACDIAGRELLMSEGRFAQCERILEGKQIQVQE